MPKINKPNNQTQTEGDNGGDGDDDDPEGGNPLGLAEGLASRTG